MKRKFDSNGRIVNPCVQMNTSITQIQSNDIEISTNDEPQYMEEGDPVVHIFKDNDYMTYRKYDPKAYAEWKASQKKPATQENADKLNPVISQ